MSCHGQGRMMALDRISLTPLGTDSAKPPKLKFVAPKSSLYKQSGPKMSGKTALQLLHVRNII